MAATNTDTSTKRTVILNRPDPEAMVVVEGAQGAVLKMNFDPEDAELSVGGLDLVLTFSDGGQLVIPGFFEGGINDLPMLETETGVEIAGRDYVAHNNAELFHEVYHATDGTHAEPASGEAAYQDAPGALIDGVNRLGKLGTDYWGRENETLDWFVGGLVQNGEDGPPPVVLPGTLSAVFFVHEDGQPLQDGLAPGADPASGPKNTMTEDGYDPATGMPVHFTFTSTDPTVTVHSLTMGDLPARDQGVLYYLGKPVTAGQQIDNPDLSGFSFKPSGNFSGDVNLTFSYVLTSPSTGPASMPLAGQTVLHVDSVADLADAASRAEGRLTEPNDLSADAARITSDGWARQSVQGETSMNITFIVHARFGDLDGSERAWIDVRLPEGFTIPAGSGYKLVTENGVNYARIPMPPLETLASSGGRINVPVTLTMTDHAPSAGNTIEIRVVTQETDSMNGTGHSTDNNTAVRVIEQEVPVALFPGGLKVEAGWAYEGDKSGGDATQDLGSIGIDASSTGQFGAPIAFNFANGSINTVTITLTPSMGTLYLDGTPVTGNGGVYHFTGADLSGHSLTFMPAPGFTDKDVNFNYSLGLKDTSGNAYTVSGKSSVVIDAVADRGEIGAPTSAQAAADTTTLEVTVDAAFTDLDGSERHFVLVEKQVGWEMLDDHDVITLYYDAQGNVLKPSGVDASGNYVYDMTKAASSREFFRVDVTDESTAAGGASHDYVVHMRPIQGATDTTLVTGTLAEERYDHLSGTERDVANNQAFDFDSVKVDVVDTQAAIIPIAAYEDHNPNQYLGGTAEMSIDGFLIVGLSSGGVQQSDDVIDVSAGKGIVMTFTYDGPGLPGTFTYAGTVYAPGSASYVKVGDNTYQVTFDASALASGQDTFRLRYNPPQNDDTDLTNISFNLPVISQGSGLTGTVTSPTATLDVDAVADKPTQVGGSTNYGQSGTAAVSGSTITMDLKAAFSDYTDGSEQHYLVLDLGSGLASVDLSSFPAGYEWRALTGIEVLSAGLTNYTDGSRYVVVHVPNEYLAAHGGVFNENIRVGVDSVTKDVTSTLDFKAVAVDVPSDADVTPGNNYSETPGSVSVNIHTVTSDPVFKVDMAYEDDTRLAHIGEDGSNGARISVSGIDASEDLTRAVITFSTDQGSLYYNGSAITLGTHNLGNGFMLTAVQTGGNTVISIVRTGTSGSAVSDVGKLTFVPSDNYSDKDAPVSITGTVQDRDSGMVQNFGPKSVNVVIDAVAQQPEDATGDVTYADGRTAAYSSLTVTARASFQDTGDGSEKHYLLIEVKPYFNTQGFALTTVAYDAAGNTLTPDYAADGSIRGWLTADPATGTDVRVVPDHTQTFIRIPVDDAIAQYDTAAGGEQTFGKFTVSRGADGSFTVSYKADVAINPSSVSADIDGDSLITGGMSVETTHPGADTHGGSEGYLYNNVGYDFDPSSTVSVAIVETRSVTLLMGQASEENAPHANVGDYTRADGAGLLVVRETPDTGDYSNEQITVSFSFDSLYKDADGNWVLPGHLEYNGVAVPMSVDPATGLVTATLVIPTNDAASILDKRDISSDPTTRANQIDGSSIRFIPSSSSYNEADINMHYVTSVEDTASGATLGMGVGGGTVVIDAVADQPVITNAHWVYADPDYMASSDPNVTLSMNVKFPDTGTNSIQSEGQYILVEKIPGMDLSEAFKKAVADAGYHIDDYPQQGILYYRIPAAFFTESASGSRDYTVTLGMTLQGSVSDIENYPSPQILAMAIVEGSHGGEPTASNNSALAEAQLPQLDFAVVNSYVTGGSSVVYEDDTPNANTGDTTAAGGTSFGLGLHVGGSVGGGTEEAVGGVNVTYADDRGTLYYKVPDASDPSGFTLVAVPSGGTIPAEYANDLQFIPKDTGDSTADKDVQIEYSVTMRDPASGAEKTLTGSYEIIIDAVAEKPLDVQVLGVTYSDPNGTVGHGDSITVSVSVDFPDYAKSADGHADHYILIQKPGEYWTINIPDADTYLVNGVAYFRIPVSSFDSTGKATASITLNAPPSGYLLYDNSRPIQVGALTVDRDPAKGPLPDGDKGETYDNNYAFGDSVDVKLNYDNPTGNNYLTVDPLFEDNTPYGNELGQDGKPNTTQGGGTVHLPPTITVDDGSGNTTEKNVGSVDLTWDPADGDLYIDGVKVVPTDDGSGKVTYTIPASDFDKDIAFRTPDNNSDKDFGTITATVHTVDENGNDNGTYTDTASPIVDAVAQVPTDLSSEPDYGGSATAVIPGENVNIEVSATFHDLDGSENLYVLVEANPSWGNPMGYDVIVGPNGIPYYKVPVDIADVDPVTGKATITVTLTVPSSSQSGTVGDDGKVNFNLNTGAMTEEDLSKTDVNGVPRGDEIRSDNNVAYNLGGSVTVTTSTAESNPVVHVTNAYAGSDRDGDGVTSTADSSNVYISGLDPASDSISKVELTFGSDHGELRYNGSPLDGLPGVTITNNGDGTSTVVITNPSLIDALTSGSASSSQVQYVPTDLSPDDIQASAKITVTDNFSSDSKDVTSGGSIIVDAVAVHPEGVSVSTVSGSVQPGQSVPVSATGSFPDMGMPGNTSTHYLAIKQIDGWELDGPLPEHVAIVSYDNVPYYVIDVDKYGNQGLDILTANPDGSYTFNLSLKAPDSVSDVKNAVDITGGALTVAGDGGSKELTYDNNVVIVSKDIPLDIGVVETKEVDFTFSPITESDASGTPITLGQNTLTALNAHNEKVTDTTLTFSGDFGAKQPGDVVGTVVYDGKAYDITYTGNGTASVHLDFGADGYDASKDFNTVWGTVATDSDGNALRDGNGRFIVDEWNHTGDNMTVTSESTVVDKASGATDTATGSGTAEFTPVGTSPSGVTADSPDDAAAPGGQVTFTVSGLFADTDGSELHYYLVEQKEGWTGDYNTINLGGKTYFMIPVLSTDPNPIATVTLTAPEGVTTDTTESLLVGGLAQDGNSYGVSFSGNEVSIDIGAVSATGVTLSIAGTDEDVHTQMLFSLDGGDNDAISSITVSDLKGGSIVDADGKVLFAGAPAVLNVADALAGNYYYLPAANASGDMTIGYTATVVDNASGASKDFDSTQAVDVAPVTDVPKAPGGAGSDPVYEAGHVASVPVHLSANFTDMDGSESHFFLVVLPDGLTAPNGWTLVTDQTLLAASGLDGQTVYRFEADASGSASLVITLPENYTGGDVSFVAGSVENANLASGNPDYQFSSQDSIDLPTTQTINLPPESQDLVEQVGGLNGSAVSGSLSITDPDGDPVSISGVSVGDTHGVPASDGSYTVRGEYGDFAVQPDGTYTYVLSDPKATGTDVLEVTLADHYGASSTSSVSVDVTPLPDTSPLSATLGHGGSVLEANLGSIDAVQTAALGEDTVAVQTDLLPLANNAETLVLADDGTTAAVYSQEVPGAATEVDAHMDSVDSLSDGITAMGAQDGSIVEASPLDSVVSFEVSPQVQNDVDEASRLNEIKLDFGG